MSALSGGAAAATVLAAALFGCGARGDVRETRTTAGAVEYRVLDCLADAGALDATGSRSLSFAHGRRLVTTRTVRVDGLRIAQIEPRRGRDFVLFAAALDSAAPPTPRNVVRDPADVHHVAYLHGAPEAARAAARRCLRRAAQQRTGAAGTL